MKLLIAALALCAATLAQTITTATSATTCAAGTDVGYTYSASALFGVNSPLGTGIGAGSQFGVKVGTCSKAIFEVAVWSGLTGAAKATGYSLATGRFEYDLVKSGYFVFGADGAIGAAQLTSTTTTSNQTSTVFQPGGHLGYDLGSLLTKNKTSLFVIAHADYTYIPDPPVPNAAHVGYWGEIRKTFK